ncbi:MAG: alkaline phosphatase D family protein [Candidatus Sericytochromatia bacterium]
MFFKATGKKVLFIAFIFFFVLNIKNYAYSAAKPHEDWTDGPPPSVIENNQNIDKNIYKDLIVSNYFLDGVASGDPTQNSVIIWTRINDENTDKVEVGYEISKDKEFTKIVMSDDVITDKTKDHTIKLDITTLKQDTEYFYRFKYKNEYSEIGRTKTLPRDPKRFRVAFVSCQNFGAGYFNSYKNILEDNPDVVVMLGDNIYEHAKYKVRKDDTGYAKDLEGFRKKYKTYFTDKAFKEARKNLPFMHIWDDHEVENDYNGIDFFNKKPQLIKDAYQAYFEYIPVRVVNGTKIYRNYNIGNLVELHLIDGRQYRKQAPCPSFAPLNIDCTLKSFNEDNTYLGLEQKQWLKNSLLNTPAKWKVIANNTMMMEAHLFETIVNYDEWDGFMKEKQELLEFIYKNDIKNTLVFTGDLHMFIQGQLKYKDKKIGEEFVTTSITSPIPSFVSNLKPISSLIIKNLNYFEPAYKGYILADFSSTRSVVSFYAVNSVSEYNYDRKLLKKFEINKF